MLVVERYHQKYWFVNSTLGVVGGPDSSMADLTQRIKTYIAATYFDVNSATIQITGTYTDHAALEKVIGEPPAWYKSQQISQRFIDFYKSKKIDPKPFFPPGYYPQPRPGPHIDWGIQP